MDFIGVPRMVPMKDVNFSSKRMNFSSKRKKRELKSYVAFRLQKVG